MRRISAAVLFMHISKRKTSYSKPCVPKSLTMSFEELNSEETHDFSKDNKSIAPRLTHILYHLKDSENIAVILSCESGELFMKFSEYLRTIFSIFAGNKGKHPRRFCTKSSYRQFYRSGEVVDSKQNEKHTRRNCPILYGGSLP